jgi:hypothetical protein
MVRLQSRRWQNHTRVRGDSGGVEGRRGSVDFEPMPNIDTSKSLQELEGRDMGEPEFGSQVVTECHRLHRVPLRKFTVPDLRIMIGQNIGLEYLVPMSLEHLRVNPLSQGIYFPGDLLIAVLRADSRFWIEHLELRADVAATAHRAFAMMPTLTSDREATQNALSDAYDTFERADYFAQHGRA